MTDHKFTDEEVIKALKCCLNSRHLMSCQECCFRGKSVNCVYWLEYNALDLINRQKAEIKTLQERNVILRGLVDTQKAEISALTSAVDNSTQEFLKLHDTYQEQKAEIERLSDRNKKCIYLSDEETTEYCVDAACPNFKTYEELIRAEAIKEFAERLKERSYTSSDWSHGEHPQVVECDDINEIVEELTEKGDNQ